MKLLEIMEDRQIILTGMTLLAIGVLLFLWSSNRLSEYTPLAGQIAGPSSQYQYVLQNFDAIQMVASYILLGGIVCLGYGVIKRRKLQRHMV